MVLKSGLYQPIYFRTQYRCSLLQTPGYTKYLLNKTAIVIN